MKNLKKGVISGIQIAKSLTSKEEIHTNTYAYLYLYTYVCIHLFLKTMKEEKLKIC